MPDFDEQWKKVMERDDFSANNDTCIEKRKEWEVLSFEEKIQMCKDKVKTAKGDIHGWFDAFNPKYNWSHSADEVKQWFEEEGFTNIKLRMIKQNINMNGILK